MARREAQLSYEEREVVGLLRANTFLTELLTPAYTLAEQARDLDPSDLILPLIEHFSTEHETKGELEIFYVMLAINHKLIQLSPDPVDMFHKPPKSKQYHFYKRMERDVDRIQDEQSRLAGSSNRNALGDKTKIEHLRADLSRLRSKKRANMARGKQETEDRAARLDGWLEANNQTRQGLFAALHRIHQETEDQHQ